MKIKTSLALLVSGFFAISSAQAVLTDSCKQYIDMSDQLLAAIPADTAKADLDAAQAQFETAKKELNVLTAIEQDELCKQGLKVLSETQKQVGIK